MAAANVSQVWGTPATLSGASSPLKFSFESIASNAIWQSDALDLSNAVGFPRILDLEIQLFARTTGTPGDAHALYLWVYGSIDGIHFPDTIAGADGAYTGDTTNITSLRQLNINASSVQAGGDVISIAAAFGGTLPAKVGFVVQNRLGTGLDTNAANNFLIYRPLYTVIQ